MGSWAVSCFRGRLVTEGGVEPARLVPRGLGDTHPVVRDEALAHYNRRLDVVWPCP